MVIAVIAVIITPVTTPRCAITIPLTTPGLDVPTMNTVQTAASIWVLEQVTVTPIPHGVAVLGTNTVMIVVHI